MSDAAPFTFTSLWGWKQPAITETQLRSARVALLRYRIMAFVTGVILIAGCVALILKYGTSMDVEPWTGYLWIAHGWLFLVYVIMTLLLAVRLRWPLARAAVVMLAGTIPTMSFVAEHFVTRAARQAPAERQPADVRD
ncbi:DUF3817 domain-containing protein [Jatrophihabitans endophyticus]|uniref:DUF3817 domain-containing protein n=1 Tax=Jatrophihabitans endophyticus TaxID=1206085 RepID=UPI0019DC54F0|nr:DUF3817 domain-containing protein [Jatrophihabitans endophyticus]MBE7190233.1 DUF3817 domain-containing protein [Jatrophihabitans endophyticus]